MFLQECDNGKLMGIPIGTVRHRIVTHPGLVRIVSEWNTLSLDLDQGGFVLDLVAKSGLSPI